MDLIDYYLQTEPGHLPALRACLRNPQGQATAECVSNLFNFQLDFAAGTLVVADDSGVFTSKVSARTQTFALDAVAARLKAAAAARAAPRG